MRGGKSAESIDTDFKVLGGKVNTRPRTGTLMLAVKLFSGLILFDEIERSSV